MHTYTIPFTMNIYTSEIYFNIYYTYTIYNEHLH